MTQDEKGKILAALQPGRNRILIELVVSPVTYTDSCDFLSHRTLREDLSPFWMAALNSDERLTKLSSVTTLWT